ncbi:hypothetical protein AGMMS50256_06430 [Betaproteobacteria bacterium]|nr:hypothetical protein AGMMS50256_06430 [Betaproteobacteria bacterium]
MRLVYTPAWAPWSVFERLLPHLDLVLLDIKHMDSDIHKKWTGVGNKDILLNARNLATGPVDVMVRLPLIPGFNDDDDNLHACGNFSP